MATFAADNSTVLWTSRYTDSAGIRTLDGSGTEVWFRIYGDSLKINYRAGGADAINVSVDGGAWAVPAGAIVNTAGSVVLSGELLPGGTSDASHDIKFRLKAGFTGGGFRIRLTDGIVVTSSGGVAARSAHSDYGEFQYIRGTKATSYWSETFGNVTQATLSGYTSPIFPSAKYTSAHTPCRNAYVEFYVDTTTTKIYVYVPFNTTTPGAESQWGVAVDDEFLEYITTPSTTNGQCGLHGPITIPGSGQRKVKLVNMTACDAVLTNGTFPSVAVPQPTLKVVWFGDSVTEGTSISSWPNAATCWDVLVHTAVGGYKSWNRGKQGATAASFNTNSAVTNDLVPLSPNLVLCNLGINDASGFNTSYAATVATYVTLFNAIMSGTSADLWVVPQLPYASSNRAITITGLTEAVTTVANSRCVFKSSDNWTVAAALNDGSHPFALGYAQGAGGGICSVRIAALPADTNTITINGTVFEFDNNASVTGGNVSVTIGADIAATINNLAAAVNAQAASYETLSRMIMSTHATFQGICLKGVTSLSVSGANLTAYYDADGWKDLITAWLPASSSGSGVGGGVLLLNVG